MRRTKEDAEQTRLKIIESALTLFSRNGYSKTTLAMIATEAGFSRGPIYWHFRNKDDLYEAVLSYSQQPLEALVAAASGSKGHPLVAIDNFARQWLFLLVDDVWFRKSFEILLNKTELTEDMSAIVKRERKLTRQIIDTLTGLIAAAQNLGQVPVNDTPAQLALLIYAYLMGITQSWLFAPNLFSLKKEQAFLVNRLHKLLTQV